MIMRIGKAFFLSAMLGLTLISFQNCGSPYQAKITSDSSSLSSESLIDSTPPTVTLESMPNSLSNNSNASFSFSAKDGESGIDYIECQLDSGDYVICVSPVNYRDLASGAHAFNFRAKDKAGNASQAASFSWEIKKVVEQPADFALTQNYGYTQFKTQNTHQGKIIDASQATWKLANSYVPLPTVDLKCDQNNPSGPNLPTNYYPIDIEHPGITLLRPLVNGEVSLESGWGPNYCNAAGILTGSVKNVVIDGARIDRVWDGFRPRDGADGFWLKNSWISNVRDDCVENDSFNSGRISDSLFDGCFVGFSLRAGAGGDGVDASSKLVEFDGVLVRIHAFHYIKKDGRDIGIASGHVFKIDGESPTVSIHDSIIAYDTPKLGISDDNLTAMMGKGSQKLKSCSNNKVLWMRDDGMPAAFNSLDPCFQVYTGATARKMWKEAKCEWIKNHPAFVTRRHSGDEAECQ